MSHSCTYYYGKDDSKDLASGGVHQAESFKQDNHKQDTEYGHNAGWNDSGKVGPLESDKGTSNDEHNSHNPRVVGN